MKINIKNTNFELSLESREYLEKKLQKLVDKFLKDLEKKGEIFFQVEIARTTFHHQKGAIFYAEANLFLPQKQIRAEGKGENIYMAIDEIYEDLERQIQKYKEKKRTIFRKGASLLKRIFQKGD